MTTLGGVPDITITRFLLSKAVKASNRRAMARQASTQARMWVQTIVRLLCHLAGFSSLTIAGFAFSFIAGMVTLGVCFFIFSALFTTSDRGTQ